MAILLSEADVVELLPMQRALELVEASFLAQSRGQAVNRPRQRIFLSQASLHYMAAALTGDNLFGMKIYTVTRGGIRFVVLLFDAANGELLAMLEADRLGRIRTGAASGVATKYLARRDASRVGMIGAGRQAETQLEAVATVRKLTGARVFCRDEIRRRDFCAKMQRKLGFQVEPAASAEEVARSGEIVITATNTREPVLYGEWLNTGTHINAIGSNVPSHREMDDSVLERAGGIAVDSIEQAKEEAGDLIQGLRAVRRGWDEIAQLHEIVSGSRPGRRAQDEITLFKSCGIAIWDVAVAGFIYGEALRRGKGREFTLSRG